MTVGAHCDLGDITMRRTTDFLVATLAILLLSNGARSATFTRNIGYGEVLYCIGTYQDYDEQLFLEDPVALSVSFSTYAEASCYGTAGAATSQTNSAYSMVWGIGSGQAKAYTYCHSEYDVSDVNGGGEVVDVTVALTSLEAADGDGFIRVSVGTVQSNGDLYIDPVDGDWVVVTATGVSAQYQDEVVTTQSSLTAELTVQNDDEVIVIVETDIDETDNIGQGELGASVTIE
jgi:hypothetical protein